TVVSTTPAAGATGVDPQAALSATFSEALDASTVTTSTFELRDAAGNLVAAAVGYNATTHVATLTPSAALANSATYTAKLHGGPGAAGVQVGHLWDSSGTLLASATFAAGTSEGWVQVALAQPVTLAANTLYVASYSTTSGHLAYSPGYFSSAGVDSGVLHA